MTTYFSDHYHLLSSPVATSSDSGLRRAQLGALYATLSHFTLSKEPAIVVLPTGSGKTAVLMLVAFWLQAKRVLVVTPSRLVRRQIFEEFRSLQVLRDTGVIPLDMPSPHVYEVTSRLKSVEQWNQLVAFDVVIGTPHSVSPAIEHVVPPPDDLFDLVLVDEAHHTPAKTWNHLLKSFPHAQRVLVTATPFRRDKREIEGKFVYVFPLSEAYNDGIFGSIEFIPVQDRYGADHDVLIAQATEAIFNKDRDAGLDHCIMVRTDTRKRADALLNVYEDSTALNLRVLHSRHSYERILETIADLKEKRLDGVICVNMLGEGFDFPSLKIAAIHVPHKSLSVTLQFIGRFARTNKHHLGTAKFLAIPSEISDELEGLYQEGAVWQHIIPDLLHTQIIDEVTTREVLSTFRTLRTADEEQDDISLYALHPYAHVRVFEIDGSVDLEAELDFSGDTDIIHHQYSKKLSATIYITETFSVPKWSRGDRFLQTQYHLSIVYYHSQSRLLFICTSDRVDSTYTSICDAMCEGVVMPVSLARLRKTLSGLSDIQFFNIGMRNRVHNNTTESYRILTGGSVHKAIRKSDGQLYNQGHSFGKAVEGNEPVTIGLSSSSKIWSNTSFSIPDSIAWFEKLAIKIGDGNGLVPASELDFLGQSVRVDEIPTHVHVIAADWNKDVYLHPPQICYEDEHGRWVHGQVLDLDIVVDSQRSHATCIFLELRGDGITWPLRYKLEFQNYFSLVHSKQQIFIEGKFEHTPLLNFLNKPCIQFYFADFSSLLGHEYFSANILNTDTVFNAAQIEVIDWEQEQVDMSREYGTATVGKYSIHAYMEHVLERQGYPIFFMITVQASWRILLPCVIIKM